VANTHSLDEVARQVAGNFGGSLGVPEPVASKRLAAKLPATISERSSAQRPASAWQPVFCSLEAGVVDLRSAASRPGLSFEAKASETIGCRRSAGTGKAHDAPQQRQCRPKGDPVEQSNSRTVEPPHAMGGRVERELANDRTQPAAMEGDGMRESSAQQVLQVSDRAGRIGGFGRGEQRLPLSGRERAPLLSV